MHLEIADFGLADFISGPQCFTNPCGTVYCCASEILKGRKFDERADMWSIGVVIFNIISGTVPFFGKNQNETIQLIRKGDYSFSTSHWTGVSEEAKELIRNLLLADSGACYTAQQALDCSWFKMEDANRLGFTDLSSTLQEQHNIAKELAKRKLNKAIQGITFLNALKSAIESNQSPEENSTTEDNLGLISQSISDSDLASVPWLPFFDI